MTKIIALCKLHWIKANAIHKVEVLKKYIYTHTHCMILFVKVPQNTN